jgi:RNA polymerase sigma factor (sigma-70 family)
MREEDKHIYTLDSQLADISLINHVRDRGIDLNKIGINVLELTPAVSASLRSANIRTLEQLSICPRNTLLHLRSIGIGRLAQIEKDLNSLLKSMLTKTREELTAQFSPASAEQQRPANKEDLKQRLCELVKCLCDIFAERIPLASNLLPPKLWGDLIEVLGQEPKSFSELNHLARQLNLSLTRMDESNGVGEYLALKRITQWSKRVVEYKCLDEEIQQIVTSLTDREQIILKGRYKIQQPLTLEVLGEQLGITRERVRQIQQRIQKKLITRIKQSTLLYSTAALYILRALKDNAILATWTKRLIDIGFLRDPKSLEVLIAISRATNSSELALPVEFIQSLETNVPERVLAAMKPVLEKARKVCRNCGAVRVLSLTSERVSEEDIEQILRLNGFEELLAGWWTRVTVECLPERVATKVVTYCGPVSPSSMRNALRRHLSRFQLPAPPSELLAKLLERRGNFTVVNGLIHLANLLTAKPRLTGPERVFLEMTFSNGPILSFETVHHKLLESGLSAGSVTSLLKYSPIVQKISVALYSLLGAKYDETNIQEAQAQLTKIPANSTLRARSDGVIEFETNAGTWLEYGGVLTSGPASSLRGEWKLINNGLESYQLVVDGNFIRGLSQVSKDLGIIPGDRIRIDFNTWTREAKMVKVVRNE